MKAPKLGISDWGYIENGSSPISMQQWMNEVTARINRLEADVYGRHVPRTELTLTAKQAEVYQYIADRLDSGNKVTLNDICKRFGYKGISSAQRMVDSLRMKNVITREGHRLSLVEGEEAA